MGEQLAPARQSHGVDAVGFEDVDGEIGHGRDNHQRHEEVVAASEFGNEEDASEWCVHHARHEACHAVESAVLGRKIAGVVGHQTKSHVPKIGEDEAGDAAEEEAGGEHSAATASAIGGCGGKDLENEH